MSLEIHSELHQKIALTIQHCHIRTENLDNWLCSKESERPPHSMSYMRREGAIRAVESGVQLEVSCFFPETFGFVGEDLGSKRLAKKELGTTFY